MRTRKRERVAFAKTDLPAAPPLCALLSQVLQAGYHGALLSMVLWNNLVRFTTECPIAVRELAHARAIRRHFSGAFAAETFPGLPVMVGQLFGEA